MKLDLGTIRLDVELSLLCYGVTVSDTSPNLLFPPLWDSDYLLDSNENQFSEIRQL